MKDFKDKKIIIWGHKLHSHTSSYVHSGFYIAFVHLGYEVYWFDDDTFRQEGQEVREGQDDMSSFDFSNCVFLTEGQVDKYIPIRNDCYYILHNCYAAKYESVKANSITLQVYTNKILSIENIERVNDYVYIDMDGKYETIKNVEYETTPRRTLYQPWATDLLPHQINTLPLQQRKDESSWIGTIGEGLFGNINELTPFIDSCKANGIEFKHYNNLSVIENKNLIRESYLAPTIVGTWQKENGYLPCRIFKNISYGNIGLTNSPEIKKIFGDYVLFAENEADLFDMGLEFIFSPNYTKMLKEQIMYVKQNHTYINRIEQILKMF